MPFSRAHAIIANLHADPGNLRRGTTALRDRAWISCYDASPALTARARHHQPRRPDVMAEEPGGPTVPRRRLPDTHCATTISNHRPYRADGEDAGCGRSVALWRGGAGS